MNLLNGAAFQRMESAVKAAEMRQQVISNNVANADTPNFKRSEIVFEELLKQEMGGNNETISGFRTNNKHIPIGASGKAVPVPRLVTDGTTSINNNGSNVDIDSEMALLAKNQLTYNLYIQQINHDVSMMRTAIGGA